MGQTFCSLLDPSGLMQFILILVCFTKSERERERVCMLNMCSVLAFNEIYFDYKICLNID